MQSTSSKATDAVVLSDKLSALPKAQTQPSIYKVHNQLRDVNGKAYEPDIIAIGPYHHGKDNLKIMEDYKLRYLQLLLKRKKVNVETYISAIGKLEQEARRCYSESPTSLSTAPNFIEMLVLDGCFIIELVRKRQRSDPTCKNDPIFKMGWIMNSLQRDMILFENQIPFFVLCRLFDLIEGPNKHNLLIHRLLYFCENLYSGGKGKYTTERNLREIKHILDLIHGNWIPPVEEVFVDVDKDPTIRKWRFIHSATELTDANVAFKKVNCDNFFKVDFYGGCCGTGIMEMSPLTIEDRTECFLRNLIAYEQYFPNTTGSNFVTDYVTLLDSLINSSRDVEILRECDVIDNMLGDNEVVANMFNQLTVSITAGEQFYYDQLFRKVNSHYKKCWSRALATLRRDYFNSPWAYLSFFAALLALLLTIAQTVFSAIQL